MNFDAGCNVPALFAGHESVLRGASTRGLALGHLHRIQGLYRARVLGPRALRRAIDLLPQILGEVGDERESSRWTVLSTAWSETLVAVLMVGVEGQRPAAIVKIPSTQPGVEHLHRQRLVLDLLGTLPQFAPVSRLVPSPLAEGEVGGQYFLVESAVPGVDMRRLDTKAPSYATGLVAAAGAIRRLHEATARRITVGEAEIEQWVHAPIRLIDELSSLVPSPSQYRPALGEIESDLRTALLGREVSAGWIHGDLWPGNVLVSDDVVDGIVDWGRAAGHELPLHDIMQLALHSPHLLRTHANLGETVRNLIREPVLGAAERVLFDGTSLPLAWNSDNLRRMLFLYWLRYVATYLVKCPEMAANRWWVRRNVVDVFRGA